MQKFQQNQFIQQKQHNKQPDVIWKMKTDDDDGDEEENQIENMICHLYFWKLNCTTDSGHA